jgi:hypothetical protein
MHDTRFSCVSCVIGAVALLGHTPCDTNHIPVPELHDTKALLLPLRIMSVYCNVARCGLGLKIVPSCA